VPLILSSSIEKQSDGVDWPDSGRTAPLSSGQQCQLVTPVIAVQTTRSRCPAPMMHTTDLMVGTTASLTRCWSWLRVTRLLLLSGQIDVVPTPGRYPAEDSETRTLAPARLRTTAAQTNPADSQCVGSAGTSCQKEGSRDAPQENSAHTR